MTTNEELIKGIDGDALPDRMYFITGDHKCTYCNRSLKGKNAYLTLKSKDLICRDLGSNIVATQSILCKIFQDINKTMTTYGQELPEKTVKKIEKTIMEILN